MHNIIVRAYDYEGDARGISNREDINGNIIRTEAYSTASTVFMINSLKSSNELPVDVRSELPEM